MAKDITRVLLVESDPAVRDQLHSVLTTFGAQGYVITTAPALAGLGPRLDCDVILAGHSPAGVDELRRVRREMPSMPLVLVARGDGGADRAVEAVEAGADEVLDTDDLAPARVVRALRTAIARHAGAGGAHEDGDRFRLLIDTTELGSLELHPQSGEMFWSERTRRLFGVGPDDSVSYDTFLQALHVHDRPRVHAALQGALRGDNDGRYTAEFRSVGLGDGQERWLASWGRVVRDPDGRPVRFIGVMLDISERKRAEGALVESDRRKTEFLVTLAHELRNPLAPMRFAVKMLQPHLEAAPGAARPLSVIDRQVSQLARLIDDLLDVSRISRNKIQLRTEPVNLATILQSAIEATEPLLEAAGHRLETDIPPAPIVLEADAARLVQVFSNLLNNAIKFTPPGGNIRLSVMNTGADVQVSVADDGMGITPEVLPYVFDLFRQEDVTLERSAGGLGIGLTLAQALVTMHGGTIDARSGGRGAGAEFIVRLPVSASERSPDVEPTAVVRDPGAPLRVLIVDDNRDAADMLELFAREQGHDAAVAYEGYTAVTAAAAFEPDLVLLDIGMPGLNGYAVARMLRQRRTAKPLFVVAVTGWGQEDDRRRARDAGFDLHLTKPVDPGALQQVFERVSHTLGCTGCDQCLRPGADLNAQGSSA